MEEQRLLDPEVDLKLTHEWQINGLLENPRFELFKGDGFLIKSFSTKNYFIAYSIDKKGADFTYIRGLYVPEKYRCQRFATRVVNQIKKECLKKNIHRIEVEATQSSYKFWKKLGFNDLLHMDCYRMYLNF
jgi:GNAT superfamily N-acetyltransferase